MSDAMDLNTFGRKQRHGSEGGTFGNARTGATGVRDGFGKQRQPDKVAEAKCTYMVFPGMAGKNAGKREYSAIIGRCGKLF